MYDKAIKINPNYEEKKVVLLQIYNIKDCALLELKNFNFAIMMLYTVKYINPIEALF